MLTKERPFSDALKRLREVGLRPTRQRLSLTRLLFDGDSRHVTAEQVHEEALNGGVKVSLATIYNTLHQFTEAGLLREVVVDAGRTYFDTNVDDHHHFFLEESGELVDIPLHSIAVSDLPAPPAGHAVARVDVVVRIRQN